MFMRGVVFGLQASLALKLPAPCPHWEVSNSKKLAMEPKVEVGQGCGVFVVVGVSQRLCTVCTVQELKQMMPFLLVETQNLFRWKKMRRIVSGVLADGSSAPRKNQKRHDCRRSGCHFWNDTPNRRPDTIQHLQAVDSERKRVKRVQDDAQSS